MKNVTIYVDVDLTLIDENRRPLPGAQEGMRRLHDVGCRLYLWSTGGEDHCRTAAALVGITDLCSAFLAKPDIYLDDMPSTFANCPCCDVTSSGGWDATVTDLLAKHIDGRSR